jgi:hypothetical protein
MVWAYRVGGNVNVLLLAVSDELRLDEERVTLDLVGSGSDTGTLDEGLELCNVLAQKYCACWSITYVLLGVVGNTDGASLGLGQFGHGCRLNRQGVTNAILRETHPSMCQRWRCCHQSQRRHQARFLRSEGRGPGRRASGCP